MFRFGGPVLQCLHRWGDIWHGAPCKSSPSSVQRIGPAGENLQNRHLSYLNSGALRCVERNVAGENIYSHIDLKTGTGSAFDKSVTFEL